jgi:RNA-binding protein YhbY
VLINDICNSLAFKDLVKVTVVAEMMELRKRKYRIRLQAAEECVGKLIVRTIFSSAASDKALV